MSAASTPSSVTIGTTTGGITLTPATLISDMLISGRFATSTNWKRVVFNYVDATFTQHRSIDFLASASFIGNFTVSLTAIQNTWQCVSIVIQDFDGGFYNICRDAFRTGGVSNLTQFDIIVNNGVSIQRWVYSVESGGANVYQFSLNDSTGALTALSPSSVSITGSQAIARGAQSISNGLFLYVGTDDGIKSFSIDHSTGKLTFLATTSSGSGIFNLTISPDSANLYGSGYTSAGTSMIYQYSINNSTGALTSIASPFSPTGNQRTYGISITPDGNWAYINDLTASVLYEYSRSGGILTSIGPSTGLSISGSGNRYSTITPDGKYLYIFMFGSNQIDQYSINDSTGALTSIGTETGHSLSGPYKGIVTPDSSHLFVVNNSGGAIGQYSINSSTGVITWVQDTATLSSPSDISITADGLWAYVTNASGVQEYPISSGLLGSPGTNYSAGSTPFVIDLSF